MEKDKIEAIVKQYVADGKIKEALEALNEYVKGIDRYIENDILMQQASFNRNTKDYSNQLLTNEEYKRTLAKSNFAITQILESLPANGNHVEINIIIQQPSSSSNTGQDPNAKKVILFLSANPIDTYSLNVELELRKVKDELSRTSSRDIFELESESAVRIPTITGAMQKHKPYIVHFSGHGTGKDGLYVLGDDGTAVFFPTTGLKRLFNLFKDQVKCVLLNACYSQEQAIEISNLGIYVIGMNKAVKDSTAIDFAVGFYQSIGEGNAIEFAYEIAMVNISNALGDADTPEIWLNGNKLSA